MVCEWQFPYALAQAKHPLQLSTFVLTFHAQQLSEGGHLHFYICTNIVWDFSEYFMGFVQILISD